MFHFSNSHVWTANILYPYLLILAGSIIFMSIVMRKEQVSDLYLTLPEIVRRNGYPAETHTVQTKDGYLLQLHRIPYGRSSRARNPDLCPVLLFHGVTSSSHDWILSGPKKALGRLADEGYDVWMANMRGNLYSEGHISFNANENEYWEFSIHEMGVYDLPANVDYILNATNHRHLVLISHSVGAAVFFIMASTLPEYDDKILAQISLAPVSAIPHAVSIVRKQAEDHYPGERKRKSQKLNILGEECGKLSCNEDSSQICTTTIIYPLFGWDFFQYDAKLTALYYSKVPSGNSAKTMQHYWQFVIPGTFGRLNYGREKNLRIYGTAVPPKYNISNINIPVRIYYGDNDHISTPIDNEILYKQLPVPLGFVRVNYDYFNHLDFIAAIDINLLLNDNVIEFVNNVTDPILGRGFIVNAIENAKTFPNQSRLPSVKFENEIKSFDEFLLSRNYSVSPENIITLFGKDSYLYDLRANRK